ncbi:MAG: sigma-54 dependent transcriptional regulator [Verrucomicrobiota bacterium]
MPRILVIDDDEAACRLVRAILSTEPWEVTFAHDGPTGARRALAAPPDLVILDLELPGLDGLGVLERIKQAHPELPVVMLTARAEIKTAVRATRLGALEYLVKPVDPDQLVGVARRALELGSLRIEVRALRRQVTGAADLEAKMGPSAAVREIADRIETVAGTDFSVLLLGETGTGKDLVAQAIHRRSPRANKPFVALDCGAIPESLLESQLFGHERGAFTGAHRRTSGQFNLAEGGTLFLDEIGNLPLGLQAKLLRVLESRQLRAVGAERSTDIDVRFLAATNDDLEERVQSRAFRADLYFRLAQYTIALPPLRARPEDIAHLAQRFLAEVSVELRRPVQDIGTDALALLQRHPWPGNVRELRNVIRRAVLESRDLVLDRAVLRKVMHIQAQPLAAAPVTLGSASLREIASAAVKQAEETAIQAALRAARGNKSEAARALRTDYKTLHLKMRAYGIQARHFRA